MKNLKLKEHNGKTLNELTKELVRTYTNAGRQKEISNALAKLRTNYKETHISIPFELAYLEGQAMDNYLHDMKLTQEHARINRETIASQIIKHAKLTPIESFDTIHNYIDTDNMILRKGSISAQAGERVIIPLNMRDGSLICTGRVILTGITLPLMEQEEYSHEAKLKIRFQWMLTGSPGKVYILRQ